MFPQGSIAVTTAWVGEPAGVDEGPVMASDVAAAACTAIPPRSPAIDPSATSAASTECVPAVRKIAPAGKGWMPSAPAKEKFDGKVDWGSVELKRIVPA